ncbi:molecular chaperone DnaJ [Vibrio zhanjiangensis]|uniref:Molecular chaperone DnaJ n=1 Tax=Vibrio zhanjiangensis TaxID=1046128 RepID=A0ABQ6ETG0_9VIBR|nr:J domain-containing protein [Vibrio zhanjiangensis]GLT16447.1 molecular chaperone DnaJ [Vibrio zhanjiangensis]
MKFVSFSLLLFCTFCGAQSIDALTTKAQNNDVQAQIQLAERYLTTSSATSRVDALYWFEQAANNGSSQAAARLATLYLEEGASKRDIQEAIYWLTRLALEGSTEAQINLGKVYESLPELPKSLDLAEVWYRTALAGNKQAEEAYAVVLEKKFNAQRAKQISSIEQLEIQFNDLSLKLDPIAKQVFGSSVNNDSLIYTLLGFSLLLIMVIIWYKMKLRNLSLQVGKFGTDTDTEKRDLQAQLAEKSHQLTQQKKQLETLYRQFKKIQSSQQHTTTKSAPVTPAKDQKLSLACALFGFQINAIPNEKNIKIRYKQLCKIYHPDLKGSDEEMKRLNGALKIILHHVNAPLQR